MLQMNNLVPPPYPDDVEEDFGPYSRDEIVVARASLIHSIQRENSNIWRNIKYKLGILPNGHRLRVFQPTQVWLPPEVPELWSAPVALHDPTASSSRITNQSSRERDMSTGRETDQYEDNKSEASATSEEPCPSSKGDTVGSFKSGKHSGKRKREENLPSDSHHSFASIEPSDGDFEREAHGKSAKKSRTATAGMSIASSIDDGGEGSSTQYKWGGPAEQWEDRQYEVVFQCDLCSFSCQEVGEIQQHLNGRSHFSASRYLAMRNAESGELRPIFLSVASLVKEPQHMFKEKVAACPQCHTIFPSLSECLSHSLSNHNELRMYSFRDVTKSESFDFVKNRCSCLDCGDEFPNKDLSLHIKNTEHMSLYRGEKTSQAMMILLCPFCQVIYYKYREYKSHVFSKHTTQIPLSERIIGTWCALGPSQPAQTMVPKDPGVALENICYDFSLPVIPDSIFFCLMAAVVVMSHGTTSTVSVVL
ncbi:hypothetical protein ACOMHN_017927 [Nucella lapillus]